MEPKKGFLLGYDIGSSSVKASLVDIDTGLQIHSAQYPETELCIISHKNGWAEQDVEQWWISLKNVTAKLLSKNTSYKKSIKAIGISYQMHGLVLVDKNLIPLRPAIIWCDSRATNIGNKAFAELGKEKCLSEFLNSPGNFTASKLRWVLENEPTLFDRIYKMMLPGDYIAMRLTGEIYTTQSGLSEAILWNYKKNMLASDLLKYYTIPEAMIPPLVETFSIQGKITQQAAYELGLEKDIPVSYRAGDQPNNAFSLMVLNNGEVAATAGTSGVVYAVSDKDIFDKKSRINTFIHVNNTNSQKRLGTLLCLNSVGISYSWLRNTLFEHNEMKFSYENLNDFANKAPAGSEGIMFFPFGNGNERIFENKEGCAMFYGIQFNRHNKNHIIRAVQEGIVFSFYYGIKILNEVGISPNIIKAGNSNLFLSSQFSQLFASVTGIPIYIFNTSGAEGAARGAGIGSKIFSTVNEAFNAVKKIRTFEPIAQQQEFYNELYFKWSTLLKNIITN